MIVKSVLIIAATSLLTVIVILYLIIDSQTNVSLDFHAFVLIAAVLLPLTAFGVVTIWCITSCDQQNTLTARRPQNRDYCRGLLTTKVSIKLVLITAYLLAVIVILYKLLGSVSGVSPHFNSVLLIAAVLLPVTVFVIMTICCVNCCDQQNTLNAGTAHNREYNLELLPASATTADILVNIEDTVLLDPQHTERDDNSSVHENNGPEISHRLTDENDGSGGGGGPPSYNQIISEETAADEQLPPNYIEAIRFINS